MNSVYIDSAVAASPIYIGPTNTNSVIIGNTNATTTLVGTLNIGTTTTNTVNIGKEGSATNISGYTNLGIVTSGTKSSYIEVGTGGGNALIDFHSSGLFDTDNDCRIMATGGTSGPGQGSLQLFSKTLSVTSPLTLGSTPTSNTHLGYVLPEVLGTVTAGIGVAIDCCNTGSLSAGTWIIVANFLFPTIASGQIYGWIGTTSATYSSRKNTLIIAGGTGIPTQGNCVYMSSSTSALTFYATAQLGTTGGSVTGTISATRIG